MTEPRRALSVTQKRTLAAVVAAVALAITGISGCPCGDACIDCSLTCRR